MGIKFRGLTPNKRRGGKKRTRSIRQVVRYDPMLDEQRRYVTDNPTPEKMATLLRMVDEGDIAALVELTDEMIAKDPHLMGVSETRRGAITALDWEIEPNPKDKDQDLARAKAEYVEEQLLQIGNFPDALDHVSEAIGPNVAVLELLWDSFELIGLVPVPGERLTGDPLGRRPGVFVETATSLGVPTSVGKWIVHHPQPNGGFPFRRTLTHSTVLPWLMIHFGVADWMAFSELYGHPLRLARWEAGVSPEDRDQADTMLNRMGTDVAGSFPNTVEIELLQAAGKGEVFADQTAYAERKLSIAWLGQTLTTDTGQSGGGAFALGRVHEGIRADLLEKDLKAERGTLECQLIAPMVALKFPDHPGPTPVWHRRIDDKRDLDFERMDLERIQKAIDFGLSVTLDDVYEALGILKPQSVDGSLVVNSIEQIKAIGVGAEVAPNPEEGAMP